MCYPNDLLHQSVAAYYYLMYILWYQDILQYIYNFNITYYIRRTRIRTRRLHAYQLQM